MVDHFHEQVIDLRKIGGEARAMVVTSGIERAIQYFHAIRNYLEERKSPYKAIVAFSGEHEYGGAKVTEASLNGFPSSNIAGQDSGAPLSFLDLRRQIPDRLRRAAIAHDVCGQAAVGHQGGANAVAAQPRTPAEARYLRARLHERCRDIQAAFEPYYRTTILADETDPNKLHDLKSDLDGARSLHARRQSMNLCELYLGGSEPRDSSIRFSMAALRYTWKNSTKMDKSISRVKQRRSCAATAFFRRSCLYQRRVGKASIFLNFLVPKLPAPKEEDLSKRHSRIDRHGQLPGGEKSGDQDPVARPRWGNRTSARRTRTEARANPSLTGSRAFLKPSTINSVMSRGRIATACESS